MGDRQLGYKSVAKKGGKNLAGDETARRRSFSEYVASAQLGDWKAKKPWGLWYLH
jgi:hypothetical protein